jgi:hypothetical protein
MAARPVLVMAGATLALAASVAATPPAPAHPEARLAQQLLERAQAREELELLLAEAMWGPVARAAYQPVRVAITVNGRQRPALLDPTGATPPRWLDEPPALPPVHY